MEETAEKKKESKEIEIIASQTADINPAYYDCRRHLMQRHIDFFEKELDNFLKKQHENSFHPSIYPSQKINFKQ